MAENKLFLKIFEHLVRDSAAKLLVFLPEQQCGIGVLQRGCSVEGCPVEGAPKRGSQQRSTPHRVALQMVLCRWCSAERCFTEGARQRGAR